MRQLPLEITQPVLLRGFTPTNNACQPLSASDSQKTDDIPARVVRNMGRRKDTAPVAERAQRWMAEHPQVYALFVRFALEVAASRKRFSEKAIVERLRWETTVQGGADFKIANAITAYLARRFAVEHPQHASIFKINNGKRGNE